jgi:hypothetical protein
MVNSYSAFSALSPVQRPQEEHGTTRPLQRPWSGTRKALSLSSAPRGGTRELDLNQGGVLRKWYFSFNNLLCGHSAKCCDIPKALSPAQTPF